MSLSAFAGTVNYSNQTAQVFSFSQISEVSPQNTFLGGEFYPWSSNSTVLRAFRGLDQYDTLEYSPGTSLSIGAQNGWTGTNTATATTRFATRITSASLDEIMGFRIRMEGITVLSENSSTADAQASVQGMLDLSFYGSNGSWGLSKNVTMTPLSLGTTGMNRWEMEWGQANLKNFLQQEAAFNPSTMKITELTLQFTPFFSATALDQASANLYVNQLQVAVIPEPSTLSLLALGSGGFMLRRRFFAHKNNGKE